MTDIPKPLTADEYAEFKRHGGKAFYLGADFAARLIATIEQRDEQIEKLRAALKPFSRAKTGVNYKSDETPERHWQCLVTAGELANARAALAATESKP